MIDGDAAGPAYFKLRDNVTGWRQAADTVVVEHANKHVARAVECEAQTGISFLSCSKCAKLAQESSVQIENLWRKR